MIAYVRVTGCGQDTWSGWNWTEAVRDWRLFATLGVPAAITMTIEYSSQEIIAIAAARFGPLALAVHPIVASAYRMCVNSFPLPVGIANANRVGHALGEANARRARRVAVAGSMLGCAISAAAALVLLCFRREVAEHYSLQLDVVAMAASLFPYAAAAALFIGINSALDGILRGQGRQLQGFLFKVVSFYVLALPIGHTLAFRWMWGVAGLWIAIATGGLATAVLQVWWIAGTDWSYEVLLCRQQIGKSTVELDGTSDEDEPGSVV
ncbi:mate-domain-containing protein [Ramicandelaber brevisporus]|nr:mate-domain-containing protein [Ramicandelaber brevisporus]